MKKLFTTSAYGAIAVAALGLAVGQAARAADVYVRDARIQGAVSQPKMNVTETVKRSVSAMPEHSLVRSEDQADIVLQPILLKRGDRTLLRLDTLRDGEVIATSQEVLTGGSGFDSRARNVTRDALADRATAEETGAMSADSGFGSGIEGGTGSNLGTGNAIGTDSFPNRSLDTMGGERGLASNEDVPSTDDSSMDRSMDRSTDRSTSQEVLERSDSRADLGDRGIASVDESNAAMDANEDTTAAAGGETRGANPRRGARSDMLGYFSLGVGPAFSTGLDSDNIMYRVVGGYNIDFSDRFTGRLMGEANLGSGSDSARLINFAVGANFFPLEAQVAGGRPFLTADLGYGFARNNADQTKDAVTAGAGAGFQFDAQQLNMEVMLHYAIMTSQLADETPSVLGLQLAVNF